MIDTSDSDAYWRKRIYDLRMQVGKLPHAKLLTFWNEILDDMYGEDTGRKKALLEIALQDENINEAAKQWLKGLPAND